MSMKKIFDYCDELTGADLLDFRSSSKLATAKHKAAMAMEHLKNVLEELDGADLLPIVEEDEENDFPNPEDIISLFDF